MQMNFIKAYFRQGTLYYSDSRRDLTPISDMHEAHAANAAQRLLWDATTWAKDAGAGTDHPQLWISTTPLFRALVKQAGR